MLSSLLRILCVLIACGYTASGAGMRALVIGNGAYRGQCRVATPSKNAQAISGALSKIGFDAAPALDLDEVALARQIDEFSASLKPDDVVFFYYSGIALQADGDNWLVPIAFPPNEPVDQHGYGLKHVFEQLLGATRVKTAFVVLVASRKCPYFADTQL